MCRQVLYILHPTSHNINPSITSYCPVDNIQNPYSDLQSPWDLSLPPLFTELPHSVLSVVLKLSKDLGLPQAFAPKLSSLPGPFLPHSFLFLWVSNFFIFYASTFLCALSSLASFPWPSIPNEISVIVCLIALVIWNVCVCLTFHIWLILDLKYYMKKVLSIFPRHPSRDHYLYIVGTSDQIRELPAC